jgi:hypothetical protein
MAVLSAACTAKGGSPAPDRSAETTSTASMATDGAATQIVVRGASTLDGKPFDSRFVGAAVLHDGLMTPCQAALPPVEGGRFEIPVLGVSEASGCGRPGARVVLWTFAADKTLYSLDTMAWPDDATNRTATFDATYDSTDPAGAAPDAAQFNGAVFDADGGALPVGTEVEALIGDVRCGVASVRRADSFLGYVMAVVGSDAVAGCTRGATIRFRVDGKEATHNPVVNTPPGVRDSVDLRLR